MTKLDAALAVTPAYAEELLKFTFNSPPTGGDIAGLVERHALGDWKVEIERVHNDMNTITYQLRKYRWEVTFRKAVK